MLNLLCIWQYTLDFIAFENFINLPDAEPEIVNLDSDCIECEGEEIWPRVGVDDWTRYEWFGYILSNSSNMKRFMVFILCVMVLDSSFLSRKHTFIGKIFLSLMTIHFLLLFPIFLTHYIVYSFVFIWILIGFCYIIACGGLYVEKIGQKWEGLTRFSYIAALIFLSILIAFYLVILLFPVPVMSQIYAHQGYISPFEDVFYARRTSEYFDDNIEGWNGKYYQLQQFIFWLF